MVVRASFILHKLKIESGISLGYGNAMDAVIESLRGYDKDDDDPTDFSGIRSRVGPREKSIAKNKNGNLFLQKLKLHGREGFKPPNLVEDK